MMLVVDPKGEGELLHEMTVGPAYAGGEVLTRCKRRFVPRSTRDREPLPSVVFLMCCECRYLIWPPAKEQTNGEAA